VRACAWGVQFTGTGTTLMGRCCALLCCVLLYYVLEVWDVELSYPMRLVTGGKDQEGEELEG
jgi:hypothetical protein